MSELTLRLGGSSGLVFSKSTIYGSELSILPKCTRQRNAKGDTEGWHWTIQVEGDVVDTTAAGVAAGFFDLTEEITAQGARSVEIIQDGTTILELQPTSSFHGPFLTDVEMVEDDGNFDGHARYRFTVEALTKGNSGPGYEIYTSIRESFTPAGKVVKKIWTARATAKTAAAALSACMTFKPGGQNI